MVITEAAISDLIQITDLLHKYDNAFTPALSKRVKIDAYVSKVFQNGYVYKTEIEGNIAGFIFFYANDLETKTAFLSMILVDKAYRGKGAAIMLIEKMEAVCRDNAFERIQLEMAANKSSLMKWYIGLGYHATKIYWRGNAQCALLVKELSR